MAGEKLSSLVLLGRIAGAHGIRGEVLIKTFTVAPEDIGAYGPLSDADGLRSFSIVGGRATQKGVVARIAGIGDRNAAEALKGVDLYIERDRLPAVAEGEFYHADLIGMRAVDPQGSPIGEVAAVHNFGAGDLLEVRLAGSNKTELYPFTHEVVPEVDLRSRQVVIVIPAGES